MISAKQNIVSKAIHTFFKYGFRSVSMDDLARELNISKKTLYNHFSNKEELMEDVVRSHMENIHSTVSQVIIQSNDPVELVFIVFRSLVEEGASKCPYNFNDLRKYYGEIWERIQNQNEQFIIERIMINLQKGKEEGLYRPELNDSIIAQLFYHKTVVFAGNEQLQISGFNDKEIYYEFLVYHLNGICTEKGRKLISRYSKKYFN